MTIQHVSAPVNSGVDSLSTRALSFARNPLFTGDLPVLHGPNPHRRMLVPDALAEVDFTRPLGGGDWPTHRSLAAHRLLGTFYESETVLLPEQGLAGLRGDFDVFYGEELRRLRETTTSDLERFAFGCLDDEIDVSGACTADVLDAYFQHVTTEAEQGESPALNAIAAARRPDVAADTYLVQLALDGLTEASAMSRNLAEVFCLVLL